MGEKLSDNRYFLTSPEHIKLLIESKEDLPPSGSVEKYDEGGVVINLKETMSSDKFEEEVLLCGIDLVSGERFSPNS